MHIKIWNNNSHKFSPAAGKNPSHFIFLIIQRHQGVGNFFLIFQGQAYRESVESFNEAYDGKYFADIEFVPRNDSGGGYSDKVNASVMAGGLPDVLTVDGPNVAAYASNGIIQPLAELTEEERSEYLPSIIEQAGIDIPDADDPWTWSEFLDILAELKPIMEGMAIHWI